MPKFYIPHAGEPRYMEPSCGPESSVQGEPERLETRPHPDDGLVCEIWEVQCAEDVGDTWRHAHSAFPSFDPSRYDYEALDTIWHQRHGSMQGFPAAAEIAFAPVNAKEWFEPEMYRGPSAQLTLFLWALWQMRGAPRHGSFDHIFASLNLADEREHIYFISA